MGSFNALFVLSSVASYTTYKCFAHVIHPMLKLIYLSWSLPDATCQQVAHGHGVPHAAARRLNTAVVQACRQLGPFPTVILVAKSPVLLASRFSHPSPDQISW